MSSTYGVGTYGVATYGGAAPPPPSSGAPTFVFNVAFADTPGTTTPVWTDLSGRLLNFRTARGRQMELNQIETGTLSADLRNQDRQVDPLNTSSAYYPNVIPIRQSQLVVAVSGTSYTVFRGDVQDWVQDWQGVQNYVPIEVFDAFDAIADADFSTDRPAELSGARINAILNAIGWPSSMRAIDTGQSLIQPTLYEVANAKSEMQLVATSESGVLFVDTQGRITFHERHRRLKAPYITSQATFSNQPTGGEMPLSDATLVYSKDRIKNSVTVSQRNGVTVTLTSTTSQTNYRRRSTTIETILNNATEVTNAAEYQLDVRKDAVPRIEEIVLEPQQDANLWAQVLGREIGDRITTIVRPPGSPATTVTSVGVIERIEHTFSAMTKRWVTKWGLSPAELRPFWVLGTSAMDTGTRLAY